MPSMTGVSGLGGPAPGDTLEGTRLLNVTLALASEVFMLKAEIERLKHALKAAGTIDEPALARAGGSTEIAGWMSTEQAVFARALLRPFTHPDEAPDVTRFMSET